MFPEAEVTSTSRRVCCWRHPRGRAPERFSPDGPKRVCLGRWMCALAIRSHIFEGIQRPFGNYFTFFLPYLLLDRPSVSC